ncbi:MAG: insulinase family protein [Cyclobacteriaceae bacterium]|nr:insulinase family protein [Cyclobacteriaceae bacterium]
MKNIISVIVLAFISFGAIAQKQLPPAGGTPKDFKIPEKKQAQLKNGLRSTLVSYGALPKVNIDLIIKTGNVHEAADQVWLADLTVNIMNEGTKTMDFKAISKKVASMGGNININAGVDQVNISGSVLSEFAPELIKVIGDIAMNPAFSESEIERLKADLKRQLSVQRSVPQSMARERFFASVYKDHAYGRYFPTEAMITSYTMPMVKNFYDQNFGAKRSVIYVVGKFDEGAVNKSIDATFGSWREGPEVTYPPAVASQSSNIDIIDRPDAPQSTIIIGLPTLNPASPDYQALLTTNLLLGGSFGSRITSNIREDKGYTYSPSSSIQLRKNSAVWFESADVTSEHTGASLQEIAKEIKILSTEPPKAEELDGIKRYEAGVFVLQNSTPSGIVNQLNFLDQNGLSDDYLKNKVTRIYAVTPEKVSQMTKDYFDYEKMTLVVVGDKKLLDKQIKAHKDSKKSK